MQESLNIYGNNSLVYKDNNQPSVEQLMKRIKEEDMKYKKNKNYRGVPYLKPVDKISKGVQNV